MAREDAAEARKLPEQLHSVDGRPWMLCPEVSRPRIAKNSFTYSPKGRIAGRNRAPISGYDANSRTALPQFPAAPIELGSVQHATRDEIRSVPSHRLQSHFNRPQLSNETASYGIPSDK